MPHIIFKYESASGKLEYLQPELYSLRNVFSRYRGLGHGNGLMRKIVDYADENGYVLLLVVQRYGAKDKQALNNKQLEEWYKKFGFVTEAGSKYLAHMIRFPRRENEGYNDHLN